MSHPHPAGKRKSAARPNMLADATAPRVLRPAPLRQAVYDAIVELIVSWKPIRPGSPPNAPPRRT